MKLSTKGRYAVTAMMDLAIHETEGAVSLAGISNSQGISLSYLEQLFSMLRRANLVHGVRGPGGGYQLAKPASEITIAAIISAVDERVDSTCGRNENCSDGEHCLTHELWCTLSNRIFEFLDNISLADFLGRPSIQKIIQSQHLKQAGADVVPIVSH